jgi:hypothetical protein
MRPADGPSNGLATLSRIRSLADYTTAMLESSFRKRHPVPQISQRPHDPVIAPITVLFGHANDQLLRRVVQALEAKNLVRTIDFGKYFVAIRDLRRCATNR